MGSDTGLSKEYLIQQVTAHKDRIRELTDRLSDVLYNARKKMPDGMLTNKLDEESAVEIRKILHEIASELSLIGGFCSNQTRKYIDDTLSIFAGITSYKVHLWDAHLLEIWAVRKMVLHPILLRPLSDYLI